MGRCRDRRVSGLCDDYVQRIRRHVSVEIVEVDARSDRALVDRIGRSLGAGTRVVALDEEGRSMDSEGFARHLQQLLAAHPGLAFLVGGADGWPDGLDDRIHERLSLSPMTLPHRLARVVLVEQIYRALSIAHGEPYHR